MFWHRARPVAYASKQAEFPSAVRDAVMVLPVSDLFHRDALRCYLSIGPDKVEGLEMSNSVLDPDLLSSVAQHVHAGNRSMARLELDSQTSVIADQQSLWIWHAWLADSPVAARSALQRAQQFDPSNDVIAAGLKFVQGLLDWKPTDGETEFDVETDFDVDPEFLVDPVGDGQVARVESDEAATDIVGAGTESVVEFELQQPDSALKSGQDHDFASLPILVVDDSPTVRKLVSLTLSTAGYEVITATDGAEALQQIANQRPALVLTDTNMPKLDGYELCRLLKKHEATDDIPVVLLSENDGVAEKLRRSMVGCRDYVAKPFESKTLIEKVRQHARVSRESDQSVDR
jgi:twitching motility two-component system response regulator PilG